MFFSELRGPGLLCRKEGGHVWSEVRREHWGLNILIFGWHSLELTAGWFSYGLR